VFADIDPESYCMSVDAFRARITDKTKAVIPVHLYGRPAAMKEISEICAAKGIALVEDSAQAHGAAIGQKRVGSWGTACFSFYPTKNMTTTEGGMVLTNDDAVADRLRMIRNQGMNTRYFHELIGYNLRMTDLCAAIGVIQLRKLPGWTEKRIENARFYNENLKTVTTPNTPEGQTHVFHQYTVRLPEGRSRDGLDRDAIVQKLNDSGIGVRVYYGRPIHKQPALLALGGFDDVSLPETDKAAAEVFSLPVHPALSDEERATVVAKVNEIC
jgi:dTDP-4-amino-4,6-dideoxygalactose transaminase